MIIETLKKYVIKSPGQSGIYIFRNIRGKSLYIGKAVNLKARLNSYLKTEDIRIKKMLENAHSIKFVLTNSDIEALILESQLIKRFHPKFNIVMRDDKQYAYVAFTNDKYPKVYITHQPIRNIEISKFMGPFTDVGVLRATLKYLRKIFPYCTCKQLHNNYCLNYHIEKCLGDCCLKIKNQPVNWRTKIYREYQRNIKAIKGILTGRKNSIIKNLEKEMHRLAKQDEFEKAIELRQKLENLKRVFENARIIQRDTNTRMRANDTNVLSELKRILELPVVPRRIEAYDISNIQGAHAVGAMVTFTNGRPDKSFYRKFKIHTKQSPNDTAMLREIISRRFNHSEWPPPDLILVDGGIGQINTARKVLKEKRIRIPVIGISKDERHRGKKMVLVVKRPIPLNNILSGVKNLMLNINSEAHRFAISYYRKTHRKRIAF